MPNPLHCRSLILATLVALFSLSAFAADGVSVQDNVTLIAFRHADRDAGQPELNATGVARAAALTAALAGQRIDAIYSPEIQRNRDTVTPLATARGLTIQQIATFGMPDILTRIPADGAVVWVGNKDNLKRLWKKADIPGKPPLNYGELFIVTFTTNAPPHIIRKGFGS